MFKKSFITLFIMSMFMLRGISIFAQEHKGLEKSKKLDPSTVYRRDIYSLKGLKGISIAVEDLPNVAIKDGLSEQQLEADAELKLRQAGIKVIPLDLNSKIPGSPILYININLNKFDEPEYYAINIALSLVQEVTLTREPSIKQMASTWNSNGLTGASTDGMPKQVRNSLKKVLDQFLNVYLAVNPKNE